MDIFDIYYKNVKTSKDLVPIYMEIHTNLINNEYEKINKFLTSRNPDDMSTLSMLGIIRLTSSWKNNLPYWKEFLKKSYKEVSKREEENVDKIFVGLKEYIENIN